MMHRLPKDIRDMIPEKMNNPFRYSPCEAVRAAAEDITRKISEDKELHEAFSEGKMIGVMVVCRKTDVPDGTCKETGYLAAFSGKVAGRTVIEGFVPPVFDLLDPYGRYRNEEQCLTEMNRKIEAMESSSRISSLRLDLAAAEAEREDVLNAMKEDIRLSKERRDRIRRENEDPSLLETLKKESQYQKAELRRQKGRLQNRIDEIKSRLGHELSAIEHLKAKRAGMSDNLQKWIFDNYIVHNALGQEDSISGIFSKEGLVPPGGSGECAAPKLLEYAYRSGLEPLAMGEFWYGKSPETAVRTHGHFYPSCTNKCGPLLRFMLKGLEIKDFRYTGKGEQPAIVHEDAAVMIISKPSGMPSVPGLDGSISLQEYLSGIHKECRLIPVHRLDMDTSGLIIFAKTEKAEINLKRQFEEHSVRKTYMARLSPADLHSCQRGIPVLKAGDKGHIELALNSDYDERPRQKVDLSHGKASLTEYEVTLVNEDGTADILFHPHTGRTHQLRVHSAHTLGLGRPLLGDTLYGGSPADRLYLHAFSISFIHPDSRERITVDTMLNAW